MFPSWRYHRTLDPRIVADPLEDEALGEGWADTPAAFLIPEEEAEVDPCSSSKKKTKKTKR